MAKTIALIPARGGSKGIPHKNIALLAGKPLLAHSILPAQEAKTFDGIFVSSDDAHILAAAETYGAATICRNPHLALDHSPTNPVIQEFIELQKLDGDDVIVLLQPTSPLRRAEHIQSALALFKQHSECAALMSVCAGDNKYLYAFSGADPYLTPLLPEFFKVSRRQDLPEIYLPNGAIYIFNVKNFQREQAIPKINIVAYVMPEEDSIDIDTPEDMKTAESYIAQRQRESQ